MIKSDNVLVINCGSSSMVGATEEELTRDKIPYETGIARCREISRGLFLGMIQECSKCFFTVKTDGCWVVIVSAAAPPNSFMWDKPCSVSAANWTTFSGPCSI